MFQNKSTLSYIPIIILLGIIMRCVVVFGVPKYYAPDEQPHFKYINYVAENKSLPVSYSRTDAPTNDWEYYQPPLYYSVMAVFTIIPSENIQFYIIRLLSVVMYGITAFFVLRLTKKYDYDYNIQIIAQTFFAFLPSYVFISSVINNDNLLNTIAIIIIFYTLFPLKQYKNSFVGVLLGLATLTKMSAIVLYAFVLTYYVIEIVKRRKSIRELLIVILWASIFSFPLFYRNLILYGSPMGDTGVNIPYQWPNIINATKVILWVLNHSFIGVIGIHNQIWSRMTYWTDMVFIIGIVGNLLYYGKQKTTTKTDMKEVLLSYLPYISMVTINFIMVYSAGYLYAQSQGRFLFASLLPIVLCIAFGYSFLIKRYNINRTFVVASVAATMIIHAGILFYELSSLNH